MKLQVGNVIEIFGWVMLNKLEDGCKYRVSRIKKIYGEDVYIFTKARGKKEVVGHYVDSVDIMINPHNNNRIEIIS